MSNDVSQPMRLRLRVNRHGLPTTHITWPVEASNASHGPTGLTIARLLEQVNEVIPLESDDWGLDDYAVEVNGFECLHFQEVNLVLRDGDTVDILPLSTTDLQLRKFSGRHQISADGRHLIDGVAFGRPNVRKPAARPPVRIPPRKRRRLLPSEGVEEDSLQNSRGQLLIQDSGYGNFDRDDSESDNSFRAEEDGESDDASREGDDHMDLDVSTENAENEVAEELGRLSPVDLTYGKTNRRSQRKFQPGTVLDQIGQLLDLVDEDGNPFPGVYENDLLDQYQDASPHKASSNFTSQPPQTPTLLSGGPDTQHTDVLSSTREISKGSNSASSRPSKKGVSFEERDLVADSRTAQTIGFNDDDDEDSDDGIEFQPDVDSDDLTTESEDSDDNSTTSTSSSASLDSSSSSSTSSSDEQSSQAAADRTDFIQPTGDAARQHEESKSIPQVMKPPGGGKSETRHRNRRRRQQKRLEHLKRIGKLPSDATMNDLRMLEPNGNYSDVATSDPTSRATRSNATSDVTEFERRRQDLLASLESGGVEVSAGGKENRPPALALEQQGSINLENPQDHHLPTTGRNGSVQIGDDKSPQRRTKLDIASSRRMVFGSLGLRVPKTKEDEDKLRSQHDALRGKPNGDGQEKSKPQAATPVDANGHTGEQESNTLDDSWKDKIILSAVECCEEGINLSTPPFPFVQRWDPQQHLSKAATKKAGKKRKRNQAKYYEEEDEEEWDWDKLNDVAGFNKVYVDVDVDYIKPVEVISSTNASLWYDTDAWDEIVANRVQEEDLPAMPTDPETCKDLAQSDIRPGAVIGFRQLKMTDNWQPEISGYRTAKVDKFIDNEIVQMTLARRDREKKRKTYDEEGRRVYGKFEMPDVEESQASNKKGLLELPFADLIEPKLLKPGDASPIETIEVDQPVADDVQTEPSITKEPDIHMDFDSSAQTGLIVNNEPDAHKDIIYPAGAKLAALYRFGELPETPEEDSSPESVEPGSVEPGSVEPEMVEPGKPNQVSNTSPHDMQNSPTRDLMAIDSPTFHGLDLASSPPSPKSGQGISGSEALGPSAQLQAGFHVLEDDDTESVSAAPDHNAEELPQLSDFRPVDEPLGIPAASDADDSLGDGLFVKQSGEGSPVAKFISPKQVMQQDYQDVDAHSSSSILPSPSRVFSVGYTPSQSVKKEQPVIVVPPKESTTSHASPSAVEASDLKQPGLPESNRAAIRRPSPSDFIDLTQDSDDEMTMDIIPGYSTRRLRIAARSRRF
ncbi:MAG: hypothetical protein M1816_003552 [Peltula sp. TS41687]|nr:MAG: hypothetical protein M1816_003552 [Peltula sp. TS41687]